jgi:uncharacterized repeat protein (TIGR03806 family)
MCLSTDLEEKRNGHKKHEKTQKGEVNTKWSSGRVFELQVASPYLVETWMQLHNVVTSSVALPSSCWPRCKIDGSSPVNDNRRIQRPRPSQYNSRVRNPGVQSFVAYRKLMAVLLLLFIAVGDEAAAQTQTSQKVRRPFGIEKRELWTTSKVLGSPEPPDPYRTEIAFRGLKFFEPLELRRMSGSNRLAIAERTGKLFTFVNRADVPAADLMLDVGRTVYGFAFHPKFAENGQLFVVSVLDPANPSPSGSRLSRFTVTRGDIPQADLKSEKVLLEWPSGGHNGGCIEFGPDGYLYLVTGDGSGIADQLETGQNLSDLLASMLRIDVDHPDGDRRYGIPKDNPFVEMKGARPELWAYGLRQVWKFSFDARTGDLWAGEVGQDLWEMVYKIEKGGNYGWSVQEGEHPFRPHRKLGPSPILKPIVEHGHTDFRSITGGYVYHGRRLPELEGAYIYGDYDTGRIWSLRYRDGKVMEHRELADTQLRIVAWGTDADEEIYLVDFIGGRIHRLVASPPPLADAPKFPRKLSETGLFASTAEHRPAAGLIPYSVNAELWSDGATKERFLAIPGDGKIEYNVITYPQPAPGSSPGWRFPDNTVLVKTFFLETEAGNAASRRRLETRILHYEHLAGTEEVGSDLWHGYTYVWNDAQTDADLLDAKGLDRTFTITDLQAPGGKRQQNWHFPSRAECTLCHTTPAKYALGVNTLQMNKDHAYGGVIANQLRTLEHLGVFTTPLPEDPEKLSKLANYKDPHASLDARARSYLHANCAHCHCKWGGGNAEFQLVATLPLAETGTLGTRPGQGLFDLQDPRILIAGDPARSMVYHRMTKLGLGRMPHIASNQIDRDAVKLIKEWIEGLPR